MYIVCYTDIRDDSRHYDPTDNYIDFENNLPSYMRVDNVFDTKTEVKNKHGYYETEFIAACSRYGYTKSDLHSMFLNKKGDRIELIGLNPRNRKYTFIVINHDKDTRMKVTKEYLNNCVRISTTP